LFFVVLLFSLWSMFIMMKFCSTIIHIDA
jgi:hypothetical protein